MKKLFTVFFLVLALLAMTAGTAFAQTATPPITGTVQSVVIEADSTKGATTVAVTLLDEAGATQTIKISLDTATTLGLVATDPTTGESTTATDAVGKAVEIDPTTVIPEENTTTEEPQHPVGSALSSFFSDLVGVDYETIMTYHDKGIGFGVIAQALWLSKSVDGGTDTFTSLLDAKQSGDYSGITLADGSTPDNWGDVVRSLKKTDNLGKVMSSKSKSNDENTSEDTTSEASNQTTTNAAADEQPINGNGNENGNDINGNGSINGNNNGSQSINKNGNSHKNGNGNKNGNGGGNGNGHGH